MSDQNTRLPQQETDVNSLLKLADHCVKCGLCLPHCPSYRHYNNEADSPRGRITLLQNLLENRLQTNQSSVRTHLDHCLVCGNCEPVCPSEVPFSQLLGKSRQFLDMHQHKQWKLRFLSSPRLYRHLKQLLQLMPETFSSQFCNNTPRHAQITKTTIAPKHHTVGIFSGCASQLVDNGAIFWTRTFLQQQGYKVILPEPAICCGGLLKHDGYQTSQHDKMVNAYADSGIDTLIYFTSGCSDQLSALANDNRIHFKIIDASLFLAGLLKQQHTFIPPKQKIAIHKPCTLKNTPGLWEITLKLVKRLNSGQVNELPDNHFCCGASGLHMFSFTDDARQMLTGKIQALRNMNPDVLLTANTGCALHFRRQLHQQGINISVMHPAEWISRFAINTNMEFSGEME